VAAVLKREGFQVRRMPQEHAGGKWRLRFPSALGQEGSLELDVNFLLRTPLWPVALRDARTVGSYHAAGITLLDDHELAGGKLAALLSRRASRDLFDAHHFLSQVRFDHRRLRLAFVVYGAINRKDWRTVTAQDVAFDTRELRQQLVPLLREEAVKRGEPLRQWGERLVEECRAGLGAVLPFEANEMEFLDRLLDHGEIQPSLLTQEAELADRIRHHPGLEWKALNVRRFKREE
jgi:hypothetical protein